MIEKLYEVLTGRPYFTTVSMVAEFGPPPAVEFAADLAGLDDAELLAHGDEVVARARVAKRRGLVTVGGGR